MKRRKKDRSKDTHTHTQRFSYNITAISCSCKLKQTLHSEVFAVQGNASKIDFVNLHSSRPLYLFISMIIVVCIVPRIALSNLKADGYTYVTAECARSRPTITFPARSHYIHLCLSKLQQSSFSFPFLLLTFLSLSHHLSHVI